jgi:hypothetical protein
MRVSDIIRIESRTEYSVARKKTVYRTSIADIVIEPAAKSKSEGLVAGLKAINEAFQNASKFKLFTTPSGRTVWTVRWDRNWVIEGFTDGVRRQGITISGGTFEEVCKSTAAFAATFEETD